MEMVAITRIALGTHRLAREWSGGEGGKEDQGLFYMTDNIDVLCVVRGEGGVSMVSSIVPHCPLLAGWLD